MIIDKLLKCRGLSDSVSIEYMHIMFVMPSLTVN